MSIRDKWILHVVLHQPLISVLGSLFDYIALDLIQTWVQVANIFLFCLFLSHFFVESMDSHSD